MQDGVFNSTPNVIAQTADGFIWIGTQAGLVRFDGSRFVSATTSTGQPLPDVRITSLRRARDGSLWIGTPYGLSRLKDGELINYSTAIGISTIIEDHEGTIWVTRYRITDGKGPLCRAADRALQCYGTEAGIPVNLGVRHYANGRWTIRLSFAVDELNSLEHFSTPYRSRSLRPG